jgi:hypothetical protein
MPEELTHSSPLWYGILGYPLEFCVSGWFAGSINRLVLEGSSCFPSYKQGWLLSSITVSGKEPFRFCLRIPESFVPWMKPMLQSPVLFFFFSWIAHILLCICHGTLSSS